MKWPCKPTEKDGPQATIISQEYTLDNKNQEIEVHQVKNQLKSELIYSNLNSYAKSINDESQSYR